MGVINAFESNVEVTKQTKYIFSLLGIWPMITNNTTISEKRVSAVILFVCQSLLIFIIITASFHLYVLENIEIKFGYFGPLGVVTACFLKLSTIVFRREKIKQCVMQIEQDWREISNENENAVMMENFKNGERITTVCACFMFCGGISHQIMMPFLPGSVVSIFDNSTKRLLVYPTNDKMFNNQITPVYEILYIIHIIIAIIICTILVGSCHLAILFIFHVSGKNQIMILKLTNLTNEHVDDERKMDHRVIGVIDSHYKIIKFMSNVDGSIREICLTSMLEALILICFAEYYSMTAWDHNEIFSAIIYFMVVQSFIGNLFIFCYAGEMLVEQFQQTEEAVNMIEWYRLSQKNIRVLIFIMRATQHPPKITAGGFITLSYGSFVSVIKTTAVYFNMLRMREV